MKKLVLLFIILLSMSQLFAGEWDSFMVNNSLPAFAPDEVNSGTTTTVATKSKNPKLAFAMSAIVPGSGQIYSKSYIKAAAFIGVEVTAWAMYFKYMEDGRQIEDEFHAYAGTHWSEAEYWKWIAHQAGLEYDANNLDPLREWEHSSFSHGLHEVKDQQYYEMIGKYHQFSWGWDDFRSDPENDISMTDNEITLEYNKTKTTNKNRYDYESQRNASNDAFQKATTATTIAILNHLLSAIDAAWTTSKYNKRIEVGLRLEPIRYAYETQTALTLRVNW